MKMPVQKVIHQSRLLIVIIVLLIGVYPWPLLAQTSTDAIVTGTTWLLNARYGAGTWSFSAPPDPLQSEFTADDYTKTYIRDTFEAANALQMLNIPTSELTIDWMELFPFNSVGHISRKIQILQKAEKNISQATATLLESRNPDGGFGGAKGYPLSNNLDTSFALQALKAANYSDTTVLYQAINYLTTNQNPDGGWAFVPGGPSNAYVTAVVSSALQLFPRTTALASAISKASAYLVAHQNPDGGFGNSPSQVYETALAYKALANVITDATVLGKAINYLTSTQLSDGSWNDDPYSTALALQALHLSENRPAPPPAPTTGTVSGTVVDSSTNQPLRGVTVTLVSNSALVTSTDTTGAFSLGNIPEGSQQITFTLTGYATSTATVNITSGSVINLGSIPLSVIPTFGILQGTVTDAATGAPLVGATISVTGAATWTATTTTDGSYRITDITPGSVSISAGKTGYYTVSGAGTITAGGTLVFSPALSAVPPTATTGELKGSVTDSSTGLPVQGATIEITPAPTGIGHATSSDSGSFSINSIDPGTYTVSITAAHYVGQTYIAAVIAGSSTDMGTIALAPILSSTTVTGKVTDAATGAPLPSVDVAVAGTTLAAKTDSTGAYTIAGVTVLSFTIQASATGYNSHSHNATTTSYGAYAVDFALDQSQASDLRITSLAADKQNYSANEDVLITATIENTGSEAVSTIIESQIKDSAGNAVALTTPANPNTTGGPFWVITIEPSSTVAVSMVWNTARFAPGDHQVDLRATTPFEYGPIFIPGAILAQQGLPISIQPFVGIANGAVKCDPTFVYAGAAAPLTIGLTLTNQSNIPADLTIQYDVKSPLGAVIESGTVSAELPLNTVTTTIPLTVFNQTFAESGGYPIHAIVYNGGVIINEVQTIFPVLGNIRIEPTRTVTPNILLPNGTGKVTTSIQLSGEGENTTVPNPAPGAISVPQGYKAELFATGMSSPVSARVNGNDELYVAESTKDRIVKVSPDGSVSIFANSGPGTPIDFAPGYRTKIDVDKNGNLYVGCVGWYDNPYNPYGDMLDTIYKITPDGVISALARQYVSPNYFYDIAGVAVSPDGQLYLFVGDTWSPHDILKIDLTTKTSTKFAASVYSPYDLLFDKEGNLYVCMSGSSTEKLKIYRFAPDGTKTVYNDTIAAPVAMAWGPDGLLYAVDASTKAVYTIDPSTKAAAAFATGFTNPYDLDFDSKGNLYVLDYGQGQIIKISKTAAVFTDVRLIDTIPTKDVEFVLSSATRSPSSVTATGDSTIVEWSFDSITAGLDQTVSYDLNLNNLIPGEDRVVDYKLELIYKDRNNKEITVELPPLSVHVLASAFDSALSNDKPSYQANEDIVLGATIKNLSEYARTVTVKILIEDSSGNLVKEVTTLPGLTFNAGEVKTFGNLIFNTGSTYAGDYRARLVLFENQTQIGETFSNLKIQPMIAATSKVATDKASYDSNESVAITSTITSQSANYAMENLTAQVTVRREAGGASGEICAETKTIRALMPEATFTFKSYCSAATDQAGTYVAGLEILSGRTVLAVSSAGFEVLSTSRTGAGLSGAIAAAVDPVYQGREETLTVSVTNSGTEDLAGLTVSVIIADPETGEMKAEYGRQHAVGRGMTITDAVTATTATLAPKTHLAVLQVRTTGMAAAKTLASAVFEVKPGIEATKRVPDVTNVLVWLNYPWESGRNCPDRALIEEALSQAGVTYHIVLDKKDFATELENIFYTDIVILGDHHPLEDHVADRLAARIAEGAGLLSSLFNRQSLNEPVLGIKFTGTLSSEGYVVDIPGNELGIQGSFPSAGRVLKIEALHPEEAIAWTTETDKQGSVKYPVAMMRQYENGKVLYFAFDLAMSSANIPGFPALLGNALEAVHKPLTAPYRPGLPVPVEITVKSLGAAFDIRTTETYPAGVRLYDPASGRWITDNPWVTDLRLEPNAEKTLLFYALPPEQPGSYTLRSEVGYLDNGAYAFYQELKLDIEVGRE